MVAEIHNTMCYVFLTAGIPIICSRIICKLANLTTGTTQQVMDMILNQQMLHHDLNGFIKFDTKFKTIYVRWLTKANQRTLIEWASPLGSWGMLVWWRRHLAGLQIAHHHDWWLCTYTGQPSLPPFFSCPPLLAASTAHTAGVCLTMPVDCPDPDVLPGSDDSSGVTGPPAVH